jgi:hypothetical protein
MSISAAPPRLHVAKSRAKLASGEEVQYAYVRYSVWDEKKNRFQPKPLASLGRVDQLDGERLGSLEGFLKEWLRKDSALPFEALQERFKAAESALQIVCSRDFGLRWLVEQAWAELGYKEAVAELAKHTGHEFRVDVAVFAMVLLQLLAPQSKRGMAQWQGTNVFFPEGEGLTHRQLYEAMDVLAEGYPAAEQRLALRLGELGVETTQFSHDTTTISCAVRYDDEERKQIEEQRRGSGRAKRWATVNDPPLRMRGHSKNKRKDLPQVVLEVVANNDGLIVHHGTRAGNRRDSTLTADAARRLSELGFREVAWAGDSGMNSVAGREALREADFELVLGEGVARTKVVRDVLKRAGRYRPHPDKPQLSYKCVVAEASEERGRERLYIVRRNATEEAHALRRIERHVEKVEAVLKGDNADKKEALLHNRTLSRYVRADGRFKKGKRPAGRVLLDRKAVTRARKQAGRSVIACDDTSADPVTTDGIHRALYDVERIFRRLKSTLEVGPIRHRRADRITAHCMVAVMANNLGRWIELKAGQTLESLQRLFANLRVQKVRVGDAVYWQCVHLEIEQEQAVRRMGYTLPPSRFTVEVDPLHQTGLA